MYRLRFASLFAVSLSALAVVSTAAVPLTDLVDDNTAFAVEITDAPSLKDDFAASALGRSWADPEIRRFFAPLVKQFETGEFSAKFKAETGRTPAEILALATGRVLLALPPEILRELPARKKPAAPDAADAAPVEDRPTPPFLLAVEVGSNAAELETFLTQAAKSGESVRDAVERYADADVHVLTKDDAPDDTLVWTVRDGVWILGARKDAVLDALDAQVKGGRSDSLGRSHGYLDARARIQDPAFFAYLNGPSLYRAVVDVLPARDSKDAANPFSIDPAVVVRALGLDALSSVYAGGGLGGGAMRSGFGLTWSERRGLFDVIAYRDGPVERPDWVPAAWTNVSSFNFSTPAAIDEILKLLDAVNPMIAGMAQGQLRNFNRQLGIDIQRDLIGNLGDRMITASVMPAGATLDAVPAQDGFDQFVAISLVDPDQFQRSIDAAKRVLGPGFEKAMTERDYLGRKLYTFTPTGANRRGFAYSVTDRWLFLSIGSAAPLESVLQALDARKPGFFARDDVRAALADVPGQAFSLQYQDSRVLLSSVCATLIKLQANSVDESRRLVDPDARPSFETLSRYWSHSVGYGWQDADGMHFHAESPNPAP